MYLNWIIGFLFAMLGSAFAAEHVFVISVDGFRPAGIEELMAAGEMENFARLQGEGVWTHNARTDYDYTFTMPNNTSMVTGRSVDGDDGHNYTYNGTPNAGATLHTNKGSYLSSIFDVAHDHGLSTAIHRSKIKLVIFDQSYTELTGAPDVTGEDNGRSKIDLSRYDETSRRAERLVGIMESDLAENEINLEFVHLVDPDRAGHGSNWNSPGYMDSLRRIDSYLGRILNLVETVQPYVGRTTIIVTADHGGAGTAHLTATDPENYVIPFYVWGADVPAGGDLYAINATSRLDPSLERPTYEEVVQPIRNGDAANLALYLLGLPAVPGSTINTAQDLGVAEKNSGVLRVRQLADKRVQLRWAGDEPVMVQSSVDLRSWADKQEAVRSWVSEVEVAGRRFYRTVEVE